jgi:hypothetical protein
VTSESLNINTGRRLYWRWVAALLMLTAWFYAPVLRVMDTSLDDSNFASYAYFTAHHFQYGTEVVPMFGPYGFVMYGSVYNGFLYWPRLVLQLFAAAALSGLVISFFAENAKSRIRWLWLTTIVVLVPYVDDLPFEFIILLSGWRLLETNSRVLQLILPALLAFLSLVKGTHLILSIATLGVALSYRISQRELRPTAFAAFGYLVSLLLCWLAAGQKISHLPSFARGILTLTKGYNDAMALEEPLGTFLKGVIAATSLSGCIIAGIFFRRHDRLVLAGGLILLGFTFVKWKHGFVRADGHVLIFHHFVAVAALAWALLITRRPSLSPPRFVLIIALIAFCTGLLADSGNGSITHFKWILGQWVPDRVQTNLAQLANPGKIRDRLEVSLTDQRAEHSLPLIREVVGDATIDLFGLQHGVIPLNGLNYHPRPMGGGSFNAYNYDLMAMNRDFLRDPNRRPRFYLMRFETIDNRLPTQDDGLALLELLQHYRPIYAERKHVLLEETHGRITAAPRLLLSQAFTFDEEINVPAGPAGQLLLARFTVKPNLLGRLVNFLYKSPILTIELATSAGGSALTRRLIPSMASASFLLSPLVENNDDFLHLYDNAKKKDVTTFIIRTNYPWLYSAELTVEFSAQESPQSAISPDPQELITREHYPMFDVAPDSIQADDIRLRHLNGHPIQPLSAPGQITWTLDGSEYELVFDHGFIPEAYERGQGNGVVFVVELHSTSAPPQILFSRSVDPFSRPEDRRVLTSRTLIPPHVKGAQLVLRSDPGPHGDNAWDWSYVARVQLKRNFASPGGPVRFNRVPVSLEGSAPQLATAESRPVTLLHVPGAMIFPLEQSDRAVTLDFGFISGAYENGGTTQGADFLVEVVRENQPPLEILRRSLHPLTNPADRGLQSARVILPTDFSEGDRLRLATRPTRGGNENWGWTYFARVVIEQSL